MSLGCLSSNLQEIYDVAYHCDSVHAELVPNIFGTHVYNAEKGWGRLWRWFFKVASLFFSNDLKQQKLQQALLKTQEVFKERLTAIQGHIETYQTYLEKKSAGFSIDENNFHLARHSITKCNEEIGPFLKFIRKGGNEKLTKLFKTYYPSDIEKGDLPFPCGPEGKTLQALQQIIDLEGLLHEELPLEILERLAMGRSVQNNEKEIHIWIDKLNRLSSKITIVPLHKAITAFINYLSTLPAYEKEPPNLTILELALSDRYLDVFEQEDPKHLQWRKTLKAGDHLVCNGRKIILGKRLGKKPIEKDHNLIFEIQEDPNTVVTIAINRVIPRIREKISRELKEDIKNEDKEHKCHLTQTAFIDIEKKGRFALIERLVIPLEKYPWTPNMHCISLKDADIITPIANLIQWMIKSKKTPPDFSPKHLMFNRKGKLRYTKTCILQELDYNALESFIMTCANGNRTVYCALMTKSQLRGHPYHRFYETMLKNALNDVNKNATNIAALQKIPTDPRIVDRGDELYKEVLKLKDSCYDRINEKYNIPEDIDLRESIKHQILTFYNNIHCSSILWPTLEKEVIDHVVKTMKLQSLISP